MNTSLDGQQFELFNSQFGTDYTDRNIDNNQGFDAMLSSILRHDTEGVKTVLEVGSNIGDNLKFILQMEEDGKPTYDVVGVDFQSYAIDKAIENWSIYKNGSFAVGDILHGLDYPAKSFDLVLTVGCLIHIPPEFLERAMKEIYRLSSRYILVAEYHHFDAVGPTFRPINWHGKKNALWAGPYSWMYQDLFPKLKRVMTYDFPKRQINAVLLEKVT